MWTVRGPWPYGPRPDSPDNITALEYIYSYGDRPTVSPLLTGLNAIQKGMIKAYRDKGMWSCAFGPTNAESYHGQYPDYSFDTPESFEVWLDWLQVFWNNSIAPICFLHGDGESFQQTRARLDPLIRGNARARKLIRIVVPTGWEPTRYGWSSNTWAMFVAWIRELLPDALVLIHTVNDVDAPVGTDENGDDNGKPNGAGWKRVVDAGLHGWLIQNGPYTTGPGANRSLAEEFAAQFDPGELGAKYHGPAWHFANGIAGWPTGSAFGPNTRIKLYNAECTSYEAYWRNLPYLDSAAWGDLAMGKGADGYLDSGTVPVGSGAPPPWVK